MIIAAAAYAYVLYDTLNFDKSIAITDSVVTVVLFSLSAWGIILLIRAYPTTVAIIVYSLVVATILGIAAGITNWQILKWWLCDHKEYQIWLRHSLSTRLWMLWILNGWVATSAALRRRLNTLEIRFQQQADAATLLREAELFKLRQQLQPHFLYNSLNSISALILIQPDKAQDMIGKLSDFLRSSVKREAQDKIRIDEELEYIRSYLAIESVRFGDRLQVSFEKECTDDATIPPFLLQPIIENAIKFGLYGKTGIVDIIVHIVLNTPMLSITITNPYDANTQPPRGTGWGLEGITRRLYLLYARTDLLETSKDEKYFTTTLNIPQ